MDNLKVIRRLNGRHAPNINWAMVDWGDEPSPDEASYISNVGKYESTRVSGLQVRGISKASPEKKQITKLFSFSKYDTLEACMHAARMWRNAHVYQPKVITPEEKQQWCQEIAAKRSITGVTGLNFGVETHRQTLYPVANARRNVGGRLFATRFLTKHTIADVVEDFAEVLTDLPYHDGTALAEMRGIVDEGLRQAIWTTLRENPKDYSEKQLDVVWRLAEREDMFT